MLHGHRLFANTHVIFLCTILHCTKKGLNIVLKKEEEEEEEEKVNKQCWITPCGDQMSSLGHRLI